MESYKHCPPQEPQGCPQNCPKMGGGKKWPKLSRLGELLNTQKNVHFFVPRPGGARAPPKCTLAGTPK